MTSSSVRKLRSWELIPPSEGWMRDADDEKEIGGMEPSVKKDESYEEDPEMEEEELEEAVAKLLFLMSQWRHPTNSLLVAMVRVTICPEFGSHSR
ncbi:hypothetical protein PIB30_056399 [Stylosanthes scabra]|uniref:Uncharacterized protein n=1 Tax=Stylosanthes scabra TaxID=79078 RepID=A0ABU6XKL0_9FABA|nr:hypothetical protein [Stylosanthes scabra]